jgi:hypothetical protein
MATYRERREARAERLRDWADKRDTKADSAYAAAKATADMIPFGQPMLVGHHSYKSDANRRGRMSRNFERSFEHRDKADEMRSKAANIAAAAEHAIYSDDPDAVDRLRERIASLEAERDRIKRFNASCRKGNPDESILDTKQLADLNVTRRVTPYSLGKGGSFPGYVLSNLSGNIKRNRDRLAQLEAKP